MDINKFIDKYGATIQHQLSIAANQVYGVILSYYRLHALIGILQVLVWFVSIALWVAIVALVYKTKKLNFWEDQDAAGMVFISGGFVLVFCLIITLAVIPNVIIYFNPQYGVINDIINKFNGN